jgi:hypothetical protein
MRSWASIIALLVVVAALGAWVYQRPTPKGADQHALATLKPSEVTRIRFERGPSSQATAPTQIVLERNGDEWRMTEPLNARAESFLVQRLLGILDAHSTVRYPAGDLARYGLDAPYAVLALNDRTFSYGAINKTTREQYVSTGDSVYLVPLAYTTDLPRSADALLARQFLGSKESPVRFELRNFNVDSADGTWRVSPPTDAGADERNAWVDAWRQASALRVARSDVRADSADITIKLADGKSIRVGILQKEPELVLLRLDESVAYHFPAENSKRLIEPPGSGGAK